MTASAQRRRHSTIVGAVAGILVIVAVIAVTVVSYTTLRSSEEGRAPEVDDRDVVSFPSTPNAVVGVVDDLDRLTSIAVLTLDPSGVGGSIVTIPVNADRTNSFGEERLPISRQPYTPGDEEQADELLSELEPLLTLTIQRARVVGPDGLAELLDPIGTVDVDLPERVVDSDTAGSGLVARRGAQQLDTAELVDAFTAIDATGISYSHHDVDVALWSAVAADGGGTTDPDVPTNEFGRPVPPGDFDEFWTRLFGGDVEHRDIAVDVDATRNVDNETDADFVLVDRRDALLVFGSISPALVSKPNEALSFSLVVGFDPDVVAELGEDPSGLPITKASMTRRFIGEMLFAQANIVSVDLADAPRSVPDVTRIEITDARFEDEIRTISERFFGDAEVVVAETVTDGVDAVVVLGADFLEQRAELLELERQLAEAAEAAVDETESSADFDVSDEVFEDADAGAGVDAPVSTDTVPDDE